MGDLTPDLAGAFDPNDLPSGLIVSDLEPVGVLRAHVTPAGGVERRRRLERRLTERDHDRVAQGALAISRAEAFDGDANLRGGAPRAYGEGAHVGHAADGDDAPRRR